MLASGDNINVHWELYLWKGTVLIISFSLSHVNPDNNYLGVGMITIILQMKNQSPERLVYLQ